MIFLSFSHLYNLQLIDHSDVFPGLPKFIRSSQPVTEFIGLGECTTLSHNITTTNHLYFLQVQSGALIQRESCSISPHQSHQPLSVWSTAVCQLVTQSLLTSSSLKITSRNAVLIFSLTSHTPTLVLLDIKMISQLLSVQFDYYIHVIMLKRGIENQVWCSTKHLGIQLSACTANHVIM